MIRAFEETVRHSGDAVFFRFTESGEGDTPRKREHAITYGQTLYDSLLSGGNASVEGTFTWKYVAIEPAVSDSNTTEYEVIFTPDNPNYETVSCKVKVEVKKADQSAPAAPQEESSTSSSITLVPAAGCEYSKDGQTWQSGNVFDQLDPDTEYTFYQRRVEDANHNASPSSSCFSILSNFFNIEINIDKFSMKKGNNEIKIVSSSFSSLYLIIFSSPPNV